MFRRKKKVVYKSENINSLNSDFSAKMIAIILSAICIILCIGTFLYFPLSGINLPTFYVDNVIWIIFFSVILITSSIGLLLVTSQGANKKLFIYYFLCGLFLLLVLLFSHIFSLLLVSLFLSCILLYFAFLTFHELHKTNLTAYYLFIPFILFTIFNLIIYYFIVMLN